MGCCQDKTFDLDRGGFGLECRVVSQNMEREKGDVKDETVDNVVVVCF